MPLTNQILECNVFGIWDGTQQWLLPHARTAQRRDQAAHPRVRIFPNLASCLRLIRALCAEVREGWPEDHRYLNMEFLKEQKKDLLQAAA